MPLLVEATSVDSLRAAGRWSQLASSVRLHEAVSVVLVTIIFQTYCELCYLMLGFQAFTKYCMKGPSAALL